VSLGKPIRLKAPRSRESAVERGAIVALLGEDLVAALEERQGALNLDPPASDALLE